jgi:hypothetical protein
VPALDYVKNFGLRAAFSKIFSFLFLKFFSKKTLAEIGSANDLMSIESGGKIDSANMPHEYRQYIEEQISRSVRRSTYVNRFRKFSGSRDRLIQQIAKIAKNWHLNCETVVSIGCRDERELVTIESLLRASNIIGVDLFTGTGRIMIADMHDLPFDDDYFDVSVAIHSMEHSFDPHKSLGQMHRVTKKGGLIAIEVPIGFEVTEFDRYDYKGLMGLISYFPAGGVSVLWAEVENRIAISKPPSLRAIFQKE